jgi:flagellar biosynthesis GTPase FlhF
MKTSFSVCSVVLILVSGFLLADDEKPNDAAKAKAKTAPRKAFINGEGPGWKPLSLADFENVNCDKNTWQEKDGTIYCTGKPVGVTRSKKTYENFELVAEWRHMKPAGNSGIFLWAPDASFTGLKPGQLPRGGIEVQVLDLEYETRYEKKNGKKSDWFTSHGDVFPVGTSKMKPFAPVSKNGRRSFPSKRLTLGVEKWNHYYVRAINGEVRLWVNGEEVSGGSNCQPAAGFMALESEGSPVEFRNLRIRELPGSGIAKAVAAAEKAAATKIAAAKTVTAKKAAVQIAAAKAAAQKAATEKVAAAQKAAAEKVAAAEKAATVRVAAAKAAAAKAAAAKAAAEKAAAEKAAAEKAAAEKAAAEKAAAEKAAAEKAAAIASKKNSKLLKAVTKPLAGLAKALGGLFD